MRVIIDTNIFCGDYFLEHPQFKLLFEGKRCVPLSLYIPEVVFDEIVNRYREDLLRSIEKFDSTSLELQKLTREDLRIFGTEKGLVERYKTFLLSRLKEEGFEFIPYPEIKHKEIVERDLARKKPFKSNGSGYRDCLIWESIKRLSLWGERPIIFISNNSKDFGAGPRFDTELNSEIHNSDRLTLYRSLREFNTELVVPRLTSLEEIKSLLKKEKLEQFDLRIWLTANVKELLNDIELETVLAGFPPGVGSARISEIVEIKKIEINDVKELEGCNKLVNLTVSFLGLCSISSSREDCLSHAAVRSFWGDGESFEDISIDMEQEITLNFYLLMDGVTNQIVSEEIVSIAADCGELCFA